MQRGISRLGLLLTLLFFGLGIYFGSQIIPLYYSYYEVLGQMEAKARKASLESDQEIKRFLLKKIESFNIPIEDPDDLEINRVGGKIIISFSYIETVYFRINDDYDWDLFDLDFSPYVEVAI
ncbi:MAG: DUF4845 domain-containing protein [bacterium]|nr:DUF4845 domain-containing protein [bacterium]